MKKTTYQKGQFAEWVARMYLCLKGYRTIAQRENRTTRKKGTGEIDLILKKRKTIIFCEVKYRKTLTDALYAIHPKQLQRMQRGAELFLKKNPKFKKYDIRFDAIALAPWQIKHLKNISLIT